MPLRGPSISLAAELASRDDVWMGGLRRVFDRAPGDWLRPRLLEWRRSVLPAGAVVPTGFEAVVRVLHPTGDGRSWADVAAHSGKVVHPLVQWCCIAEHFDGYSRHYEVDPDEGSIPEATLEVVLEHLPADGDAFHAVWDGFGFWQEAVNLNTLVRGRGGRSYLLFQGPKAAHQTWPGMAPISTQSANLVWPKDHSWCVATEIDWDSTLVAGSAAVVRALLADRRIESFPVDYRDDLSWFGDTINPRPPWLTQRRDNAQVV